MSQLNTENLRLTHLWPHHAVQACFQKNSREKLLMIAARDLMLQCGYSLHIMRRLRLLEMTLDKARVSGLLWHHCLGNKKA